MACAGHDLARPFGASFTIIAGFAFVVGLV